MAGVEPSRATKEDKGQTTITVESSGTTKSTGWSLQRYLAKHDPTVPEPSQPPPPPMTKGFEVYFLYVAIAAATLVIAGTFALLLF